VLLPKKVSQSWYRRGLVTSSSNDKTGLKPLIIWFLLALFISAVANAHHAVVNRDATSISALWAAILGAIPAILWAGAAHIVAVDRRRLAVGVVFVFGGALAAVQSYGALYWSADRAGLTIPALFPILIDVLGGAAGFFAITSRSTTQPTTADVRLLHEVANEPVPLVPDAQNSETVAELLTPETRVTQKERGYLAYKSLRDSGYDHESIRPEDIASQVPKIHPAKVRQYRREWNERYLKSHQHLHSVVK
jgi:hypothetical protein